MFDYLNLIISFGISIILFFAVRNYFKSIKLFDINDLKISKSRGVVTSTGIVFLIVFLIQSLFNFYDIKSSLPNRYYIFFGSVIFLSLLSFYDDLKNIDPKIRLIFQLIIVYFSLTSLPLTFFPVPLKLLMFISLVIWVYIINVTNFVDGLDGFCATSIISYFIGVVLICKILNLEIFSYIIALYVIPILLAFLIFNKPKASIFMGDAGSIFLGYLVGFTFLEICLNNKFNLAISIFLYPLMDCTITIIKKIMNGHLPWARLSDYFFLIPVKSGKKSHTFVLNIYIFYSIFNLLLLYFQIVYSELIFFMINLIITFCLITYFNSFKKYLK
tara:strand:+ start:64 stop:1053 length:990 start_codon:yes stop_codon:yes gene_type:complete